MSVIRENGVTFMNHVDASIVTEEQVRDVSLLPAKTETYIPVPNGLLVDLIREGASKHLGGMPAKTHFSMNKTGTRMFGTMSFNLAQARHDVTKQAMMDDTMLSFGFGNSYDKSLKLRLVAGAQIFICDNLCYSGNSLSFLRKHTPNVLVDIREKIRVAMLKAKLQYDDMLVDLSAYKQVEISPNRGAELIGLAQYQKLLPDTAANIARKDWRDPRHPDFANYNLYSLYNCFTEGVKKGEPGKRIERQVNVHEFFEKIKNQ